MRILESGFLASAGALNGRQADGLARESSWGEPADYFEHVMLANGRCTAPEAVALSRQLGRDLVPRDLTAGYPPAVRFYFDCTVLVARRDAIFDGVHPVKIHRTLALDGLLAIVVPGFAAKTVTAAAGELIAKVVVLDMPDTRPEAWAPAACAAAEGHRTSAVRPS